MFSLVEISSEHKSVFALSPSKVKTGARREWNDISKLNTHIRMHKNNNPFKISPPPYVHSAFAAGAARRGRICFVSLYAGQSIYQDVMPGENVNVALRKLSWIQVLRTLARISNLQFLLQLNWKISRFTECGMRVCNCQK